MHLNDCLNDQMEEKNKKLSKRHMKLVKMAPKT